MIKDYTFENQVGKCIYHYDDKKRLYTFLAKMGAFTFGYGIPKNPISSGIFSTEGDIMDTCRGLMDILTVMSWDGSFYASARKLFKNFDSFIPTFVGNYHQCLLENTPWTEETKNEVLKGFSKDGAEFFRQMLKMFIDNDGFVMIAPLNAVVNQ